MMKTTHTARRPRAAKTFTSLLLAVLLLAGLSLGMPLQVYALEIVGIPSDVNTLQKALDKIELLGGTGRIIFNYSYSSTEDITIDSGKNIDMRYNDSTITIRSLVVSNALLTISSGHSGETLGLVVSDTTPYQAAVSLGTGGEATVSAIINNGGYYGASLQADNAKLYVQRDIEVGAGATAAAFLQSDGSYLEVGGNITANAGTGASVNKKSELLVKGSVTSSAGSALRASLGAMATVMGGLSAPGQTDPGGKPALEATDGSTVDIYGDITSAGECIRAVGSTVWVGGSLTMTATSYDTGAIHAFDGADVTVDGDVTVVGDTDIKSGVKLDGPATVTVNGAINTSGQAKYISFTNHSLYEYLDFTAKDGVPGTGANAGYLLYSDPAFPGYLVRVKDPAYVPPGSNAPTGPQAGQQNAAQKDPSADPFWQDAHARLAAGQNVSINANTQDTANFIPGFVLDALRAGGGTLRVTYGDKVYTITAAAAKKLTPGTNYSFETLRALGFGKPASPQTGTASQPWLYAGLAALSTAGLCALLLWRRRRQA